MNDLYLGALIKDHRKKAGLTQLELANLAGVVKTTVFDIKKIKNCSLEQSLSNTLGIKY